MREDMMIMGLKGENGVARLRGSAVRKCKRCVSGDRPGTYICICLTVVEKWDPFREVLSRERVSCICAGGRRHTV